MKKIGKNNFLGEKKENGINQQILSNGKDEQNDKIKQEEDEIELLKFIECFNNSSADLTLNSSFEENSDNYEDYNFRQKLINDMKVNYNNIL